MFIVGNIGVEYFGFEVELGRCERVVGWESEVKLVLATLILI